MSRTVGNMNKGLAQPGQPLSKALWITILLLRLVGHHDAGDPREGEVGVVARRSVTIGEGNLFSRRSCPLSGRSIVVGPNVGSRSYSDRGITEIIAGIG